MNVRATAALIICDVMVDGRSLTDCLLEVNSEFHDPRDRALLQAICYGVCRWFYRLNTIANALLERPMKEKDLDLHALVLVGLYQLMEMRIPDYAAVTETVAATKKLQKVWAKALVNGLLREFLRHADDVKNITAPEAVYAHPRWMIEKIEKAYPDDWEKILNANNEHPPLALRVNQQRITREKYLEKLAAEEMKADIIAETHSGIMLENPVAIENLPGFSAGEVSVQDGAAQLAAELLLLEPNQKVLDACAAPGGKTAHILELEPSVKCIAVDHDATRLMSVDENLKRLNLSAQCIAADIADIEKWWDGELFDRILLDAPCSASGVIRRHPDIKLLRRVSDISRLAVTQLRLLKAIWQTLKPNGVLLYATCSIFPEENVGVIQQFLAEQSDATEEKIESHWGSACLVGKQILPGAQGMDGFYFARLRKQI